MMYSLQQLLEKKGTGATGPLSPVLFAQGIAKHMEHADFNLMVRVNFSEHRYFQEYENGEGWTGHDTLILGLVTEKNCYLGLWVDLGTKGLPVALIDDNEKTVDFAPIYQEERSITPLKLPPDQLVQDVLREVMQRRTEFAIV